MGGCATAWGWRGAEAFAPASGCLETFLGSGDAYLPGGDGRARRLAGCGISGTTTYGACGTAALGSDTLPAPWIGTPSSLSGSSAGRDASGEHRPTYASAGRRIFAALAARAHA